MAQVDLTNCDREPIHIPGAIQPHGCLLVCDAEAVTILRHSANARAFLDLASDDIVGRKLEELIGGVPTHELRNALARSGVPSRAGLMPALRLPSGRVFDVAVHRHESLAFLEFEERGDAGGTSPLEFTRTLVGRLTRKKDIKQIVRDAAKLLRAVLQYDRVMIYRFAQDGSGQVISEAKRGDLESFSGQHFPASDIPQQARRLYVLNPIRIVSDASGVRVPIVPELDEHGRPLDMSYAHLRSVSPIHCEYLRNMGVAASMSISIIVDGELWGLIACHHYTPRWLSMSQRMAAEIFGEFFSLQLENLLQKEKLEAASRASVFFERLLSRTHEATDAEAFLAAHLPEFAKLLPCDGIGLWLDGRWTERGSTPPAEAIPELTAAIGPLSEGRVWASHQLGLLLSGSHAYGDNAAGVLAVPLSRVRRDYLLFFRKEVVQTIEWGGDPNKSYTPGPLGDRLTPRTSFAIWKQTVEGQSAPWTAAEMQLAETARSALIEIVLKHGEMLAEERLKAEKRQEWLNQELNHRVKNILALISSVVSQTASLDEPDNRRIEALKGRISALALAHDQVIRSSEGGRLSDLLVAELSPYDNGSNTISIAGPPVAFDARAFSVLALVFHELATNAAKYGAMSCAGGKLEIDWRRNAQDDCVIEWRESDGPAVRKPTRQGFGSVLINQSVPFDLGGRARIDYAPQGFFAEFVIPANFTVWTVAPAETRSAEPAAPPAGRAAPPLEGRRILLVEDQFLIALDVEEMLQALGPKKVDVAATVATALELIEADRPDFAVLDVNLGTETTEAVAERLHELRVPFVFATGYGGTPMEERFGVPAIRKPYTREALTAALAALAER